MNNSIQSFRTAGWPIWAGSRISSWPLRSYKSDYCIIHKMHMFLSFFNKFSINRYSSVMYHILSVNIQYWRFTVVDGNPKPLPSWHTHILLLLYKKNTVCLRYRHERERKRRLRYFEKEIGPYSQADGKNRIQIGRTCKETRCLARTLSAPWFWTLLFFLWRRLRAARRGQSSLDLIFNQNHRNKLPLPTAKTVLRSLDLSFSSSISIYISSNLISWSFIVSKLSRQNLWICKSDVQTVLYNFKTRILQFQLVWIKQGWTLWQHRLPIHHLHPL